MHRYNVDVTYEERDRGKVFYRIERDFLKKRADPRIRSRNQQRVTIGRRFRDYDGRRGSNRVIDKHGLAERPGDSLRDLPRREIVTPAGAASDDADGFTRKVLRACDAC